jgi:hypothetical protein
MTVRLASILRRISDLRRASQVVVSQPPVQPVDTKAVLALLDLQSKMIVDMAECLRDMSSEITRARAASRRPY